MRKRFFYLTGCAILAIAASITSAYADHGHTTIAVPECQAYINVLETADQLYFCRTTAVELTHGDPADDLGAASAVLILNTLGAPVRTVSLPNPDYALASIYFAANDTDIPVWNATTTNLHLSENPAFFGSPATSTPATVPEFNPNIGLSETATEITADLPRIMLRLETDDPDIGEKTYVRGTSVTIGGKTLITDAFVQLGILGVGAFALPIEDTGGAFTNPNDPAFVTSFEAAGRSSQWAQDIETMGLEFGFPYVATILVLMVAFLILIVVAVWRTSKETSTVYIWVWPVMFIGSSIDGWPFAATVLVGVIAAALAISIMIQRHISA